MLPQRGRLVVAERPPTTGKSGNDCPRNAEQECASYLQSIQNAQLRDRIYFVSFAHDVSLSWGSDYFDDIGSRAICWGVRMLNTPSVHIFAPSADTVHVALYNAVISFYFICKIEDSTKDK